MAQPTISMDELEHLLSVYHQEGENEEQTDETPLIELLASIEAGELGQFFTQRTCAPGELIICENDPGDSIYLIRSGRAAVIKGDFHAPAILGFRTAGGMIGEMALLENQPRSASVVALETTHLWGMSQAAFYQLSSQNPGFSIKMMGMLSSRLRKSDQQRSRETLTVRQRDESIKYLRDQAVRDGLTGLFNRRYLEETLTREIARAKREDSEVGILMLDVDHFKRVNDTYGHPAGDALLRALADMLTHCVRFEDVICRYGGEEFVVIMPGAPLTVVCERAEAIRQEFQALRVAHADQVLTATISIGAAAYPLHGEGGAEVLRCADQALYQAKQAGRNRVVVYE